MMTLLTVLCVLVTANVALTALVFARLSVPNAQERLERKVDEHMARDLTDEGFENIMRFSVNGKTGFEAEAQDEE